MNQWNLTVERSGADEERSGQLKGDKFSRLVTSPEAPLARVNIVVGESFERGALRVSASVTLSCDQNERTIDRAGELAFYKARELVTDAVGVYASAYSEPVSTLPGNASSRDASVQRRSGTRNRRD